MTAMPAPPVAVERRLAARAPGAVTAGWFAGAAAVAVLWTSQGLGLLLTGLPLTGPEPLSALGADARSAALFGSGLIAGAALLAAFAIAVHRRFRTGPAFLASFLFGLAGQVIAAIVPINGPGVDHAVHTVAGLVLGASLPILMWRFAAAQPPGAWRRACYRLFWLEAAACVVGIGLSRAMKAPIAEVIPAAAFHLWIFVVTFGGYRTRGLYLMR